MRRGVPQRNLLFERRAVLVTLDLAAGLTSADSHGSAAIQIADLLAETAIAALRGPAGVLFARGGTSAGGFKWVPDQELHFDISPRNLNLGR